MATLRWVHALVGATRRQAQHPGDVVAAKSCSAASRSFGTPPRYARSDVPATRMRQGPTLAMCLTSWWWRSTADHLRTSQRRRSRTSGKKEPPAHWPSASCKASRRAPKPSVAIRVCVASQTSGEASSRSTAACTSAGAASPNAARTRSWPTSRSPANWPAGAGLWRPCSSSPAAVLD
jgi:hypothetical protein